MTAVMRPAGAPGGLRLDAMTPAAALRSAAGGCLMGFKSLARKRDRFPAVTAGRELSAASGRRLPCFPGKQPSSCRSPSGPPGPAALLRLTALRLRSSRGPGPLGCPAPPPLLAREMPGRPPPLC